jgi:hypothetical protein
MAIKVKASLNNPKSPTGHLPCYGQAITKVLGKLNRRVLTVYIFALRGAKLISEGTPDVYRTII